MYHYMSSLKTYNSYTPRTVFKTPDYAWTTAVQILTSDPSALAESQESR